MIWAFPRLLFTKKSAVQPLRCVRYRYFTWFHNVKILWKATASHSFWRFTRNSAQIMPFQKTFYTRKLSEITVFYGVLEAALKCMQHGTFLSTAKYEDGLHTWLVISLYSDWMIVNVCTNSMLFCGKLLWQGLRLNQKACFNYYLFSPYGLSYIYLYI